MNSNGIVFIFAAFVLLVIVLGWFGYVQAKKRREALAMVARGLGWDFSPDRETPGAELESFAIFQRGHNRYAYNTLRGSTSIDDRACPALCGDFTYQQTTGSGKDRRTTTYHFSYLIVQLPYPNVPDLLIR